MTFLLLISSCCQEKAKGCYSEASVLSFFFQVYTIYLFWLNEDLVCYASLSYSTRNQHDCPKVCFRAGSCVPFVLLCIFNVINTRLTCTEIQSVFNVGCLSHIPKTACFWHLWNKYLSVHLSDILPKKHDLEFIKVLFLLFPIVVQNSAAKM